jgi:uncharacterized protein YdaU (DUF1376 family)
MSKAPAMPMYWDAYLADTTHLTTEEHGAYMLLLAAMWRRNGSVPDDDKDNARILGLTPAKWRKVKARFVATISGFRADGDTITQEKLRKTWENTQEKIATNAANGAKGGRAAASKTNDLAQANATQPLKRKATIPEPEPEPDKERESKDSCALSVIVADESDKAFAEFWTHYPRKIGRAAASKAFAKASKKHKTDDILFGLSQQIDTMKSKDQQFIPHAATWLNAERWQDEPEQPNDTNNLHGRGAGSQATQRPDASLERIARLAGVVQASGDDRF